MARLGAIVGPCAAVFAEHVGYHTRTCRKYRDKGCSRMAKERVGHLCLCTQHAKLARDGLIDENGHVAHPAARADVRRYPRHFPGGLYHWLKEAS
jgi:hypothetical protein